MTYDRWNPPKRTVVLEHDHPVFVPPDQPYGAGDHVTDHPAGFKVRTRGDTDGMVTHSYRCPTHGLIDVSVRRGSVPDVVSCLLETWCVAGAVEFATRAEAEEAARAAGYDPAKEVAESQRCGDDARWAGSQCGIGVASGEVKC